MTKNEIPVYVVRDDYDQTTVGVVTAESQEKALDEIEGDLYVAFSGSLRGVK